MIRVSLKLPSARVTHLMLTQVIHLDVFFCGASVQDPVPSNVGEASVDHANEARRSDKIMVICQFLGTRNVNVLNRKHPQSGFIAGVPCLG